MVCWDHWHLSTYSFQKKFDTVGVAFPDGCQQNGDAVLVVGVDVRTLRHLKRIQSDGDQGELT